MGTASRRKACAWRATGAATCRPCGPTRRPSTVPSSTSWPTRSTRCHAAAPSPCAWGGARPRRSRERGRAAAGWPSRSRTPAWASSRRTWIASSIRSSPPRRAGPASGSRSPRRSSRTTGAPSTSAARPVRARSSASSCRSCRTRRWTWDMTTASDDVEALRRDLDDTRERVAALERELAEARPLESLGRLTVSIAHDFRNVMAAIAGQNQLLLDGVPADGPTRRRAEAIRKATGWGERLARVLLAAGRPQPPGPAVADLNAVVLAIVRTLQPLLGEDIEVRTELEPRVGAVALGAAALEQIAMNLILNARDRVHGAGGPRQRRRSRVVRAAARRGHGHRHGRGDARARLRAVLHDEGGRQGHGARALDRPRRRHAPRRSGGDREHARPRRDVHGDAAARRRRGRPHRPRGGGGGGGP